MFSTAISRVSIELAVGSSTTALMITFRMCVGVFAIHVIMSRVAPIYTGLMGTGKAPYECSALPALKGDCNTAVIAYSSWTIRESLRSKGDV